MIGLSAGSGEAIMSSADGIRRWIQQIKDGDQVAVQELLERLLDHPRNAELRFIALPSSAAGSSSGTSGKRRWHDE